jgi:hypothetical protein
MQLSLSCILTALFECMASCNMSGQDLWQQATAILRYWQTGKGDCSKHSGGGRVQQSVPATAIFALLARSCCISVLVGGPEPPACVPAVPAEACWAQQCCTTFRWMLTQEEGRAPEGGVLCCPLPLATAIMCPPAAITSLSDHSELLPPVISPDRHLYTTKFQQQQQLLGKVVIPYLSCLSVNPVRGC